MGILYLVSTPIGNLEDITLRALRVLREVSLIAAEDTRHTQRLLARYDIHVPCLAYHEHNKLARLDDLLTALANGDVALVSDAGTPGLSDPGFELINVCIAAGYLIVPIPGPSAPITALVASGLPTDQFTYLGFLPRRGAERRALFTSLVGMPQTLVCFEAPHRVVDALTDILTILGDRRLVVARELTKLHEEFRRERISAALAHFQAHRPRGEFTLVIEGRGLRAKSGGMAAEATSEAEPPDAADDALAPSEADVAVRLRELRDQGKSGSAAARQVARELGLNKGLVYQIWIGLDE
jgi:16S rRNA (cytidine1402-2'-O)-methyltransferase